MKDKSKNTKDKNSQAPSKNLAVKDNKPRGRSKSPAVKDESRDPSEGPQDPKPQVRSKTPPKEQPEEPQKPQVGLESPPKEQPEEPQLQKPQVRSESPPKEQVQGSIPEKLQPSALATRRLQSGFRPEIVAELRSVFESNSQPQTTKKQKSGAAVDHITSQNTGSSKPQTLESNSQPQTAKGQKPGTAVEHVTSQSTGASKSQTRSDTKNNLSGTGVRHSTSHSTSHSSTSHSSTSHSSTSHSSTSHSSTSHSSTSHSSTSHSKSQVIESSKPQKPKDSKQEKEREARPEERGARETAEVEKRLAQERAQQEAAGEIEPRKIELEQERSAIPAKKQNSGPVGQHTGQIRYDNPLQNNGTRDRSNEARSLIESQNAIGTQKSNSSQTRGNVQHNSGDYWNNNSKSRQPEPPSPSSSQSEDEAEQHQKEGIITRAFKKLVNLGKDPKQEKEREAEERAVAERATREAYEAEQRAIQYAQQRLANFQRSHPWLQADEIPVHNSVLEIINMFSWIRQRFLLPREWCSHKLLNAVHTVCNAWFNKSAQKELCAVLIRFPRDLSPTPELVFLMLTCQWEMRRCSPDFPERDEYAKEVNQLVANFLSTKDCWTALTQFCGSTPPPQLTGVIKYIQNGNDQLTLANSPADCFQLFFAFKFSYLFDPYNRYYVEALNRVWRRAMEGHQDQAFALLEMCGNIGLFEDLNDELRTRLLRLFIVQHPKASLPKSLLRFIRVEMWINAADSLSQLEDTLERWSHLLNDSIVSDNGNLIVVLRAVLAVIRRVGSRYRVWMDLYNLAGSTEKFACLPDIADKLVPHLAKFLGDVVKGDLLPDFLRIQVRTGFQNLVARATASVLVDMQCDNIVSRGGSLLSDFPRAFETLDSGAASEICIPFILRKMSMTYPSGIENMTNGASNFLLRYLVPSINVKVKRFDELNDLITRTQSVMAEVKDDKVTRAKVQGLRRQCLVLSHFWTQPLRLEDKFDQQLEEFDRLLQQCQKIIEVSNFLRAYNILNLNITMESLREETLVALRNRAKSSEQRLETLDKASVPNVRFLVEAKSGAFMAFAKRASTKSQALDIVKTALQDTEHFYTVISGKEDPPIHRFKEVFKNIVTMGIALEDEIKCACLYLGRFGGGAGGGGKMDIDAAMINKLMTASSKFLQYCEHMPELIKFMSHGHYLSAEKIAQLESLTKEGDQTLMKSVPVKLERIIEALSAQTKDRIVTLQPSQLGIFAALNKIGPTIEFLRQHGRRFEMRRDELTGLLQGNAPGLSLLNNVLVVLRILAPFIQPEKPTLGELVGKLAVELPQDANDIEQRGNMLFRVNQEIDQVRSWTRMGPNANSIDTLIPYIKRLLEFAQYRSRLALHQSGQRLALVDTKNLEEAESGGLSDTTLQDIIRALRVFNTRINPSGQNDQDQDIVKQFIGAYEYAGQLHKARLELENAGHPDFQGAESDLNKLGQLGDLDNWINEIDYIEAGQEAWGEKIKQTIEEQPRFLFLSRKALCKFVAAVLELNEESEQDDVYLQCIPFLFLCFPDLLVRGSFQDQFTSDAVYNAWCGAHCTLPPNQKKPKAPAKVVIDDDEDREEEKENEDDDEGDEGDEGDNEGDQPEQKEPQQHPEAKVVEEEQGGYDKVYYALMLVRKLLETLEEHFDLRDYFDEDVKFSRAMLPKIVRAHKFTPENVHCLLVMDFEQPRLHPSQLLVCGPTTSEVDIDQFTSRCNRFPSLSYYLLYVNKLNASAREALLKTLSQVAQKNSIRLQNMHLVFTENHSEECFSFLSTIFGKQTEKAYHLDRIDETKLRKEEIVRLELVAPFSDPQVRSTATGKSTWITEEIRKVAPHRRIQVTVNEDFHPMSFIDQLRLIRNSTVAIHFTISPYADLESLNNFLFNMVIHGFLFDQRTGDSLHLASLNTKFSIFFEISTGPPGDRKCANSSTVEKFIANLPAVKICSTVVFQKTEAANLRADWMAGFLIKDDELIYLAAKYLCWKSLPVTDWPKQVLTVPDNPITTQQALVQLRGFLESQAELTEYLQDRAVVRTFLRMFGRRCRDLAAYVYFYAESDRTQLMSHVLDSLDRFTTDSIRLTLPSLLQKTPYMWTSCDDSSHLTSSEVNFTEKPSVRADAVTLNLFTDDFERACSSIANGLGLAQKAHFLSSAIRQEKYIPSPELMLMLLILHERRQSGLNVVFSGGTGWGKTKLLSLYSVIANAKSELLCPVVHEVHTFIVHRLIEGEAKGTFRCRTLSLFGNVVGKTISHHPVEFPKTVEGILRFIHLMSNPGELQQHFGDALKAVPENIPADPETGLYGLMSTTLLDFLGAFFQHPCTTLIKKTQAINTLMAREEIRRKKEEVLDYEPDQLVSLVKDVLYCEFENLFEVIMMHQNISAEEFRQRVIGLEAKANTLAAADPSLTLVVFIDECNTTSVMGLLKEVYCDRKLDGRPIASNIFFVAAINPPQSVDDGANDGALVQDFALGGGVPSSEFVVRPLPLSMERLVIEFPNMAGSQEQHILRQVFQGDSFVLGLVQLGQDFVRDAKLRRIHVSIRDILRAKEIYHYFSETKAGEALLGSGVDEHGDLIEAERLPSFERPQRALMMTMALAYYFRLPGTHRPKLAEQIQERFDKAKRWRFTLKFNEIVQYTLQHLYRSAKIPPGIAAISNLLENFFAVVVATDLKIPLVIVGPPGCSKTLSFTIALDNMSSTTQAKTPLFQLLGSVQPFRYQCSDASTDTEIEANYRTAIQRQELFEGDNPEACQTRCTVLLDEAGIPDEDKMPLKIIHFFTDANNSFVQTSTKVRRRDVRVGTVMLSNRVLDAAKMSRCMQVYHSNDRFHEDLPALCWGILNDGPHNRGSLNQVSELVIAGLCKAYKQRDDVITTENTKDIFHLRDFVFFLRLLRQLCLRNDYDRFEFSKGHLVHALQRHFGGLTAPEFTKLVQLFVNSIGEPYFVQLHRNGRDQCNISPVEDLITQRTITELIMESQHEKLSPKTANVSSFRYIMIIDSTDTEAAIPILFSSGVCTAEETDVVRLGDFELDNTEASRADAVLRIKTAMEDGKSVIIINGDAVFGSFYDVFNKHFVIHVDEYNEEVNGRSVPKTRERLTANVAVGSYSRPCEVHPNFRLIVHMPLSRLRKAARPLLNRFEKQPISLELTISRTLDGADIHTRTLCDLVLSGMDDFVEHVHASQSSRLFYGLVPGETVRSILMTVLAPAEERRHSGVFSNLTLPFSFLRFQQEYATRSGKELSSESQMVELCDTDPGFTEGGSERGQILKIIRLLNFKLLQIARPESFFLGQRFDAVYTTEYMRFQEHLSVVRFLDSVFQSLTNLKDLPQTKPASAWCVFTRSSPELHLLQKVVDLDQLLYIPLQRLAESHPWLRKTPQKKASQKPSQELPQEKPQEQPQKKLDRDTCKVMSLDSVLASVDCEREIKDFFDGDAIMLIVVINLATSRSSQINLCRDAVRRYQSPEKEKMVFMLMHSPPEMNSLNYYNFHSIWSQGWDLCYIDSLGVDSTKDSIPQVDVRSWISVAYGIGTTVYLQSVVDAFKPILVDCAQEVIENLFIPMPPDVVKRKLESNPTLAKFYSNHNVENRLQVIQTIFKNFHQFDVRLLESFGRRWSNQRGLIHEIFAYTCKQILKGEVVVSLVKVVSKALRFMLAALVREAIQASVFYCGLYPLADVKVTTKPWTQGLARLVATALELPSSMNLLKLDVDAPLFCPQETNPNTTFPFFHYIEDRIQVFVAQATRQHPNSLRDQHAAYLAIVKASSWNAVFEYIESDPGSTSAYLKDWITRVLYRVEISTECFPLFEALQHLLCRNFDVSMDEKSLIRNLPFLKLKFRRLNSFTYFCLQPLFSLCPKVDDLAELLRAIQTFPPDTPDFNSTLSATLASQSCVLLHLKLGEAVNGDASKDLLTPWISVFAAFRGRFPSRIAFEELLSSREQQVQHQAITSYDMMSTVFLICVDSQLPWVTLQAILKKLDLQRWLSKRGNISESWKNCLSFLTCAATELEIVMHGLAKDCLSLITHDLLQYGLNDLRETSSTASDVRAQAGSIFDVTRLVLNCLLPVASLQDEDRKISEFLRTHLSFSWLCTTFAQLVKLRSASWIEQFIDCLFSFMSSNPYIVHDVYDFEPVLMPATKRADGTDIIPPSPPNPLQLLGHLVFFTLKSARTWSESLTLEKAVAKYETNKADLAAERVPEQKIQLVIFRAVLAANILELAADSLNRAPDPVVQAQQWSPQVTSLLRDLLGGKKQSGAPQYAPCFFFHLLECKPDLDVASKIMLNGPVAVARTILQLPDWEVSDKVETHPHYWFRFMWDETFPTLGPLYKEFSTAVRANNVKCLDDFVKIPERKYLARMFSVLVAYYQYFNECKPCPVLLGLVKSPVWRQHLEINDHQLAALVFLCSGAVDAPDDAERCDVLLWNFSRKSRQGNFQPSTAAHLMVNFMAVCLGSPPNTNHFSEPMFEPAKINTVDPKNSGKAFAPGSSYSHYYWDCGYQTYPMNGQPLSPSADVLGNHTQYRLAVNAMVWGAVTWCLLLNPANEAQVKSNHHFLNALSDVDARRPRLLTELERCRTYTFERTMVFFGMLEADGEYNAQKISAPLFMTQSLFFLWQEANRADRNPALKAHFSSEAEAIQYENFLRTSAMEKAFKGNQDEQVAYQKKVVAGRVLDLQLLRRAKSAFLPSPVISQTQFTTYLTEENDPALETQKTFVIEFLKKVHTLPVPMRHVPSLIVAKDLLVEVFGQRITEAEADSSYLQCLQMVEAREPEIASQVQSLRNVLAQLRENWAYIASAVNINVCGAARREGREFEGQLPVWEDDTPLRVLLKLEGGSCLISTVLDELLTRHNEVLRTDVGALGLRDSLHLFGLSHANIDEQTLLVNPSETAYLTMGKTDPEEFIGTLSTNVKQSSLATTANSIHDSLFVQRSAGLHFEHVVRVPLLHLRLMATVTILPSQTFPFKPAEAQGFLIAENDDLSIEAHDRDAQIIDEGLEQKAGIYPCLKLLRQLEATPANRLPFTLTPLSDEQRELLKVTLKDPSQEELEDLADMCRRVIKTILSQSRAAPPKPVVQDAEEEEKEDDEAIGPDEEISLADFIQVHLPSINRPNYFESIHNLAVNNIASITQMICIKSFDGNFLFHSKLNSLKVSLLKPAKDKWLQLQIRMTRKETPVEEVKKLRGILTNMMQFIQSPSFEAALLNVHVPLVELLRRHFPEGEVLWEYILPEVSVNNFVPFLRLIHRTLSVTQEVTDAPPAEPSKTGASDQAPKLTYRERVTDELAAQSIPAVIEVIKPTLSQTHTQHVDKLYLGNEDFNDVEDHVEVSASRAKGLRGLINPPGIGMCYINSVVQALSALPAFREAVLSITTDASPQQHIPVIVRELGALFRKMWFSDNTTPLMAKQLLAALNGSHEFAWTLEHNKEHDVSELLLGLLGVCGPLRVPESSIHAREGEDFVEFSALFQFETASKLKRKGTLLAPEKHAHFLLYVPDRASIAETLSLQTMIDTGFKEDPDPEKPTMLLPENPPAILMLAISRFTKEGTKDKTPVTVDSHITFGKSSYQVVSMVVHQGGEVSEGHYVTQSLLHGRWRQFDDSSITPLTEDDVRKPNGGVYLVLCQRADVPGLSEIDEVEEEIEEEAGAELGEHEHPHSEPEHEGEGEAEIDEVEAEEVEEDEEEEEEGEAGPELTEGPAENRYKQKNRALARASTEPEDDSDALSSAQVEGQRNIKLSSDEQIEGKPTTRKGAKGPDDTAESWAPEKPAKTKAAPAASPPSAEGPADTSDSWVPEKPAKPSSSSTTKKPESVPTFTGPQFVFVSGKKSTVQTISNMDTYQSVANEVASKHKLDGTMSVTVESTKAVVLLISNMNQPLGDDAHVIRLYPETVTGTAICLNDNKSTDIMMEPVQRTSDILNDLVEQLEVEQGSLSLWTSERRPVSAEMMAQPLCEVFPEMRVLYKAVEFQVQVIVHPHSFNKIKDATTHVSKERKYGSTVTAVARTIKGFPSSLDQLCVVLEDSASKYSLIPEKALNECWPIDCRALHVFAKQVLHVVIQATADHEHEPLPNLTIPDIDVTAPAKDLLRDVAESCEITPEKVQLFTENNTVLSPAELDLPICVIFPNLKIKYTVARQKPITCVNGDKRIKVNYEQNLTLGQLRRRINSALGHQDERVSLTLLTLAGELGIIPHGLDALPAEPLFMADRVIGYAVQSSPGRTAFAELPGRVTSLRSVENPTTVAVLGWQENQTLFAIPILKQETLETLTAEIRKSLGIEKGKFVFFTAANPEQKQNILTRHLPKPFSSVSSAFVDLKFELLR